MVIRSPSEAGERRGSRRSARAAFLDELTAGDRRSIGRSDEVAERVVRHRELLAPLIGGMLHDDPLVRMRAADAVEKATRRHPAWLAPFKRRLLGEIAAVDQPEVRWHVAQMLPRLRLASGEEARAVRILMGYLKDESRIVKTFSMQAHENRERRHAEQAR